MGYLHVTATGPGKFELYRIASQDPIQFVSEQVGTFNEKISLVPGSYLLLADCSSETLIIRPRQTLEMQVHNIRFIAPSAPSDNDRFSIQCTRLDQTRSRQHLINQFSLNVFASQSELLVGMVPLSLPRWELEAAESPQTIEYSLASISVAEPKSGTDTDSTAPRLPFFVSSSDSLLAVTESQQFNRKIFLTEGNYTLELNGTRKDFRLQPLEEKQVVPAYLRVSTSEDTPIELASKIRGAPIFVELNQGHWIHLNQTYPVLPGDASLKLDGSNFAQTTQLIAGQLNDYQVRSVTTKLDCTPWEWTCLGSRRVLLYHEGQLYPFATGVSDVPLLFMGEDVWVGIEGSRNIRYRIDSQKRDTVFEIGHIKLTPNFAVRTGQITDLVRIEANSSDTSGVSLDINLEEESLMPLIAGTYNLASYVTINGTELQRASSLRPVRVVPGKTTEISFSVVVSESRMAAMEAAAELRTQREQRQIHTRWAQELIPTPELNVW